MRLFAALTLLFTLAPVQDAERVRLEWNFKEGDVYFVEHTILRKESLETKGKPFRQTSTLVTNFSFTVKERTASAIVFVQKIEAVKHKAEGSSVGETPGSLADKMAGATFTIILGAAGRIIRFDGYDAFIKKVADGNAEFEKTARLLLPEDVMRQMSEDLWNFLPPRPVVKGDLWRREVPFPLGPFGSFKGANIYAYEGPAADGEIISYTGTLLFVPPPLNAGAFRVPRAQLKAESSSGRYVFDAKQGRLRQATNSVLIKGQLTIAIMDTLAEMDFVMEQTTTMRVLDKNPQEK